MQSFQIREIKEEDNPKVAQIIRKVMTEYQCVGDGFSINDPEVDNMYEAYSGDRAVFYVIENESNKKLLGVCGIAQLEGASSDTCELRKMYFLNELRGYGMGQRVLDICLGQASHLGYKFCYLETCKHMKAANSLYHKNGFKPLTAQKGNTGHSGCDAFYEKALTNPLNLDSLFDKN